MRKSDLLVGMLIGLVTTLGGSWIFIFALIDHDLMAGIAKVKATDNLGKIITLGAVLNLIAFFILLHYKKDLMARGVILATIILAILTIFV